MSRQQNPQAIRLATKHYLDQLKSDWRLSLPGMLLPGIGTILVAYTPPLIVATILTKFGRGQVPTLNGLMPYVALIAGVWLLGELIWRVAMHFILLVEGRGMNRLYVRVMDYLLEKDLAFFHNNFAGSLTKKPSPTQNTTKDSSIRSSSTSYPRCRRCSLWALCCGTTHSGSYSRLWDL